MTKNLEANIKKKGVKKVFCAADYDSGIPPRVYRTVDEIAAEIKGISERIAELNSMLNIREVMSGVMEEVFYEPDSDLGKKAERAAEIYTYAAEVLLEMQELYASLEGLKKELVATVEHVRVTL